MLIQRHADLVVVQAPAKVNLFLETLKKRPDGYHEIITFMVAVNLFDTLRFKEESTREIRISSNDKRLPAGPDNLIWRAADVLRRHTGVSHGVHVRLTKRIPLAAGLAGGSSDAAATLAGLNELWRLDLSVQELTRLAASLGSDIPFFLHVGQVSKSVPVRTGSEICPTEAAWCTGRGEKVAPFPLQKPLDLLLACPAVGLSTAEVYRQVKVPARPHSPAALRRALRTGDADKIGAALHNRLQAVAERQCLEVKELRNLFQTLSPAGHAMSGSGTSYFALCRGQRNAQALARRVRQLQKSSRNSWMRGLRLFVVQSFACPSSVVHGPLSS